MATPELVAVKATKREFYGLQHMPEGTALDEHGEGMWPLDQFTWRLRDEGAIRIVEPADPEPEPSDPAPAARKRS